MCMIFQCRTLKPEISKWYSVTAETANEAANQFHHDQIDFVQSITYRHEKADGDVEMVAFALIEIEGCPPVVSRVFRMGIYRRGAVTKRPITLADIANRLDYTHAPETLLDTWDGEETY